MISWRKTIDLGKNFGVFFGNGDSEITCIEKSKEKKDLNLDEDQRHSNLLLVDETNLNVIMCDPSKISNKELTHGQT